VRLATALKAARAANEADDPFARGRAAVTPEVAIVPVAGDGVGEAPTPTNEPNAPAGAAALLTNEPNEPPDVTNEPSESAAGAVIVTNELNQPAVLTNEPNRPVIPAAVGVTNEPNELAIEAAVVTNEASDPAAEASIATNEPDEPEDEAPLVTNEPNESVEEPARSTRSLPAVVLALIAFLFCAGFAAGFSARAGVAVTQPSRPSRRDAASIPHSGSDDCRVGKTPRRKALADGGFHPPSKTPTARLGTDFQRNPQVATCDGPTRANESIEALAGRELGKRTLPGFRRLRANKPS
jgi:hypothetical protein